MKKYCLIFLLINLTIKYSFADHFVGYDMCLINVKNSNGQPTDNYKVRVRIFRDVLGIPIPTNLSFTIYGLVEP